MHHNMYYVCSVQQYQSLTLSLSLFSSQYVCHCCSSSSTHILILIHLLYKCVMYLFISSGYTDGHRTPVCIWPTQNHTSCNLCSCFNFHFVTKSQILAKLAVHAMGRNDPLDHFSWNECSLSILMENGIQNMGMAQIRIRFDNNDMLWIIEYLILFENNNNIQWWWW